MTPSAVRRVLIHRLQLVPFHGNGVSAAAQSKIRPLNMDFRDDAVWIWLLNKASVESVRRESRSLASLAVVRWLPFEASDHHEKMHALVPLGPGLALCIQPGFSLELSESEKAAILAFERDLEAAWSTKKAIRWSSGAASRPEADAGDVTLPSRSVSIALADPRADRLLWLDMQCFARAPTAPFRWTSEKAGSLCVSTLCWVIYEAMALHSDIAGEAYVSVRGKRVRYLDYVREKYGESSIDTSKRLMFVRTLSLDQPAPYSTTAVLSPTTAIVSQDTVREIPITALQMSLARCLSLSLHRHLLVAWEGGRAVARLGSANHWPVVTSHDQLWAAIQAYTRTENSVKVANRKWANLGQRIMCLGLVEMLFRLDAAHSAAFISRSTAAALRDIPAGVPGGEHLMQDQFFGLIAFAWYELGVGLHRLVDLEPFVQRGVARVTAEQAGDASSGEAAVIATTSQVDYSFAYDFETQQAADRFAREMTMKRVGVNRLALLGDVVLNFVVAYESFRQRADDATGLRIALDISNQRWKEIAAMGLPSLQASDQEKMSTHRAGTLFEAAAGAIYLDLGCDIRRVIKMYLEDHGGHVRPNHRR